MEKISPNKPYSLLEVQKLLDIKSRQYLTKYIKDNLLKATIIGQRKSTGRRYCIFGSDVIDFKKRYKNGKIKKFYVMKKIK